MFIFDHLRDIKIFCPDCKFLDRDEKDNENGICTLKKEWVKINKYTSFCNMAERKENNDN